MADPPKPSAGNGGNLFAAGNSSDNKSLFGGANTGSGNSLFGNASSSSAPSTNTSIFGAKANSTSSSNLFGAGTPATNTSSGFLFGNTGGLNKATSGDRSDIPSADSAFSTPNKSLDTTATSNAPQPLFNVGGNTANKQGGLFGNLAPTDSAAVLASGTTTPAPKAGTIFSFGNNNLSTTPAGPPPGNNAAASAPSLFGSNKSQQPFNMMSGGTGNQNASQATGPSTASTSSSNIFGSSTAPNANGVFAQKDQSSSTASATGLFNAPKPTDQPSHPFGGLGASTGTAPLSFKPPSSDSAQQSKAGGGQSTQSTSGLFANMGGQKPAVNTPTQPAASSLFSGAGAKAPTSAGPSSFFPTAPAQSSSTTAAGASAPAASPFTLGGSTTAAASSSASTSAPVFAMKSASSLFATPGQGDKGKGLEAPTAPSTSAAATSSTTPASSAAKPLFGMAPPASMSASTTQGAAQTTAPTIAADAAKTASATASTAGPKPTPQSRLKNKSMDEILTRWASDLSKYQKEFQKQAEKVAEWDRLLVDNSEKIQKLYGSTLEAERATIEVERQLSAVENDQAELEYWLDHYEKQVDELMANQVGQSDSLQGPDQERERTYKLAEKLSDHLDEMNKDLTGMIEEINASSDTLAKTKKADEPLEQIVRVLNGHLQQLQQIDQGTAALQAKISETQKNTRLLGNISNLNGPGNDAVDDFYKSYMGRR